MQKAIIVTAPSGAGKTTLVRHLLQSLEGLSFSVSATTRPKRPNEVHGKDYYFLSPEAFKEAIANQQFLEWEEVYENLYYGTLNQEVERIWGNNMAVIFDVDVKGALELKKKLGKKALAIYIMPPSVSALKERLQNRGTETAASIARRAARYKEELQYADQFDTKLVNDDLEVAKRQIEKLVSGYLQPE